MKGLNPLVVAGLAAIVAVVLPFVGSDYAISFSIQLLIFLVLAYSWNWIGGYTGYTHFGQVGFFGIGAYVGSLLNFHWGVPWYLAAMVAAAASTSATPRGVWSALPPGDIGAVPKLKELIVALNEQCKRHEFRARPQLREIELNQRKIPIAPSAYFEDVVVQDRGDGQWSWRQRGRAAGRRSVGSDQVAG